MEVDLGNIPFAIDFHPTINLVSSALITGEAHIYRYFENSEYSPTRLLKIKAHRDSCRAARFIDNGETIITASSDRSILASNVETGAALARLENAHDDAIFSLINLDASTIASGDDQGCVKVWDTRQRSCCNTFNAHEDYVSDMAFASDSMKLLATSGDGTLSVCNLQSNKVQTRSEFSEEELLSVVIMKNRKKVVCGTQNGTLMLYSWGFFKDCSDRFTGLAPNSVDTLVKLDEDRLIAGTESGVISLIGILPNQVLQPLAEHSEYPIERLGLSHDKKFLGSISHDQTLKIWDLEQLLANSVNGNKLESDDENVDMEVDVNLPKPRKANKKAPTNAGGNLQNFFADL